MEKIEKARWGDFWDDGVDVVPPGPITREGQLLLIWSTAGFPALNRIYKLLPDHLTYLSLNPDLNGVDLPEEENQPTTTTVTKNTKVIGVLKRLTELGKVR